MTVSLSIFSDGIASSGEVVVTVNINGNPGFLTMALTIDYDSQAMSLTEIENGKDFTDYNFVPAKELKTGCRASWFTSSLQNYSKDGELMKLHFRLADHADPGEYFISIKSVDDGSVVDINKKPLTVIGEKSEVIVK